VHKDIKINSRNIINCISKVISSFKISKI